MAEEKKKPDIKKSDQDTIRESRIPLADYIPIPEKMERPKPWPSPPDSPGGGKESKEEE